MRYRHATMVAFSVAGMALATQKATAQESVAYQINPAHSGAANFTTSFAPPLNSVWSVDLGGAVSYPIIAQGKVFVTVSSPTSAAVHLYALSIKTGQVVWKKFVRGASPFLAYDSGRLFVSYANGPVTALEAGSGKPLWSTAPLDQPIMGLPIAAQGSLFVSADGSGTVLYQINDKTGGIGWTKQVDGGLGPTLGLGQLYYAEPCDVAAYAPGTGGVAWDDNSGCGGGGGTVASYYRGRLYAPGVNDFGGITVDAKTGKPLSNFGLSLPAFNGNMGYGIANNTLTAINLSTGNMVWSYAPNDQFSIPPVVVNGVVYQLSASGVLYALSGATGALLQQLTPGLGPNGVATYPALGAGDGALVVPSGSLLTAYVASP